MPDMYEPLFDGLLAEEVDKTSALDRLYIPHEIATFVQARTERLLREAHRNRNLAARALLVTGPSGIGKSEALQVFKTQVSSAIFAARGIDPDDPYIVDEDGMTRRKIMPIVYYNVPERADLKDFYAGFMENLGDTNPIGSTSALRLRVQKALKDAETRLIIIDELQHLFDTENMRVKRNVANAIKRLLDVAMVPMVICGMEEGRQIFGPTLETKRRTEWCINLKPYDLKVPQGRSEFFSFLANYDEALVESGCFSEGSGLADSLRGGRIHFAARGCAGHAARLIKAAGTLAIEAASPFILDAHFRDACELIFLQDPKEIDVNPFELAETPSYQVNMSETAAHSHSRTGAKGRRVARVYTRRGPPSKAAAKVARAARGGK